MALSEDVKSQWYQALFEEDCIAVMKLLDADPRLLKEGWEREPSRQVEGRKRREGDGRTKSAWKGRTALHVGAIRGCVKLIMQVLRLCNFEDFDEVDEAYQTTSSALEGFSFSNFVGNDGYFCDGCDGNLWGKNRWNSTVKPDYDLCPDCYEKLGNGKDYIKIECGLRKSSGMGTLSSTSSSDGEATRGTPGQSPDSSPDDPTQRGDPQRGREQAAEKIESVSLGPAARKLQKAVSTIVRKNRLDKSEEQASGGFVSDMDVRDLLNVQGVRDLLNAQDGECGLDVRAIASVHRNRVVILLLEYASQTNKGLVGLGWKAAIELDDLEYASTYDRKLLRQTIIEATSIPDFTFELYNNHRDFNFLPPEEYLFHFMLAGEMVFERNLASKLWRAVRSSSAKSGGELWRFLLKYQDGQGRSPFHVAMEGSLEKEFLELIENPSSTTETGTEREVVVCAMTTPDGAGRTPIYRAAARGIHRTVGILVKYASRYEEVAATCFEYWRSDDLPSNFSWTSLSQNFNVVSQDNDFLLEFHLPRTPLHAAMIHQNLDCAKLLIEKWLEFNWGDMTLRSIDEKLIDTFRNDSITLRTHKTEWGQEYTAWIEWDIVEFSCLAGAPVQFMGFLLDRFKVCRTTLTCFQLEGLFVAAFQKAVCSTPTLPEKYLYMHPLVRRQYN